MPSKRFYIVLYTDYPMDEDGYSGPDPVTCVISAFESEEDAKMFAELRNLEDAGDSGPVFNTYTVQSCCVMSGGDAKADRALIERRLENVKLSRTAAAIRRDREKAEEAAAKRVADTEKWRLELLESQTALQRKDADIERLRLDLLTVRDAIAEVIRELSALPPPSHQPDEIRRLHLERLEGDRVALEDALPRQEWIRLKATLALKMRLRHMLNYIDVEGKDVDALMARIDHLSPEARMAAMDRDKAFTPPSSASTPSSTTSATQ